MAEAPASKTGDYFGTYLDALEGLDKSSPTEARGGLAKIVTLLATKSPRPVFELAKETELTLTEFTSELEAARTGGFVDVTGTPPDEQVTITAAGEALAASLTDS